MTLTTATRGSVPIALVALLVAGCGDGDVASVPSEAEPGGGVRGGPIAGKLEVFAIDAESSAPIAGAEIWLGEGSSATLAATTNADGYATIEGDSLVGPQSLGARALGHASVAWLGVVGSEVTLPLARIPAGDQSVTLQATIAGWDALPAPAPGKRRVARIAAARPLSLDALDGPSCAPASADTCTADESGASCALSIEASAATNRLLAVIAEGDDSELVAVGLAELAAPDLGSSSGELSLQVLGAESITAASVAPAPAPSAVFVIGVPGLGADGQVTIFPCFEPALASHVIPVGADSGSLWAMGLASFADGASVAFERGLELPGAPASDPLPLEPPAFLERPDVSVGAAGFSLQVAPEAKLHTLSAAAGTERLDVVVLDDRGDVSPPAELVPQGTLEVTVTAVDSPVDLADFAWTDLAATATRRAYRRR
jgi:hypothetical protein